MFFQTLLDLFVTTDWVWFTLTDFVFNILGFTGIFGIWSRSLTKMVVSSASWLITICSSNTLRGHFCVIILWHVLRRADVQSSRKLPWSVRKAIAIACHVGRRILKCSKFLVVDSCQFMSLMGTHLQTQRGSLPATCHAKIMAKSVASVSLASGRNSWKTKRWFLLTFFNWTISC